MRRITWVGGLSSAVAAVTAVSATALPRPPGFEWDFHLPAIVTGLVGFWLGYGVAQACEKLAQIGAILRWILAIGAAGIATFAAYRYIDLYYIGGVHEGYLDMLRLSFNVTIGAAFVLFGVLAASLPFKQTTRGTGG